MLNNLRCGVGIFTKNNLHMRGSFFYLLEDIFDAFEWMVLCALLYFCVMLPLKVRHVDGVVAFFMLRTSI
jgi:hypothetical protein